MSQPAISAVSSVKSVEELGQELLVLQQRLREAEETIEAIRNGEVDALLIETQTGLHAYTITGADRPYRIMVETMQEGAVTLSDDGTVIFANQRFSDMLGIPLEQIIGQTFLNLVPDEQTSLLFPLLDPQAGDARKVEIALRQRDDSQLPVQITASEFSMDDSTVHCLVVMDLTHQRRHEHLRDVNRLLEERVVERTQEAEQRARQLQALAGELSRAEQQERKRIAQLLHDGLQQTLVAAKMRVDLILKQVDDDILRENLAQVMNLLSDSIGSSRTLTLELSPPILYDRGLFPALDWLSRHFEEEHLLDVGLDIANDTEQPLDEEIGTFLFQAVRECLFNIVKYAHTRSAHVRVYCKGPLNITIEVSDNGIGCDISKVTSDGAKRGFGIFSIQQRVELFGGTLFLDSNPGEGFFVSITVPREAVRAESLPALTAYVAPAAPPEEPVGHEEEHLNGEIIRVLLVDDHKVLRDGISMLLQSQPDIRVIGQAGNGKAAIDCARMLRPDIVVMDVSMPGMSGLEATRHIALELENTRIIALSMHEESDMASAMIEAGASAYIPKDGPAELLVAAIRNAYAGLKEATA